MEGRGRHLNLYGRLNDVLDSDQPFAMAALAHRDAVDELAGIYSLRLQRALDSVYAVQRRSVRTDLAASALADGVRVVQSIDQWYLDAVDQLRGELWAAAPAEDSEPIQRHRAEVAEAVGQASAIAIAGGHVGLLLRCLKLFAVNLPAELPVVAWSAGAMSLTERVVLYNDRGPSGVIGSEVWDRGLGRAPRIVAMPHARRRLQMDDPMVLRVLAAGSATPAACCWTTGPRVALGPNGELPAEARIIGDDGLVHTLQEPSMTVAPGQIRERRRLAINRLIDRRPLDGAAIDRFLERHGAPIVEGDRATFLWRGEADEVMVRHRVVGLAGPAAAAPAL